MELGEEYRRPTTKWVKGELLDTLEVAKVDPRGLIAAEPGLSPFDQVSWIERVAAHWPEGSCEPLILHTWNEGGHCWLFLARDGRTMKPLANWYTLAFRPVFVGTRDRDLLRAMARRMAKSPSVAPVITLAPVPRADGTSDLIMASFAASGWHAYRHKSSTSWTIDVSGKTFAQYWEERPGELRSTHKRKGKKADLQIEILSRFDAAAWDEYVSVYADSWKPAEGSLEFLRAMAEDAGARETLRLGIARHEGRAVAAQLWEVSNGVAYIQKLAHRTGLDAISPGTILSHAMFRHVIDEDHVDLIDFGTGNDRYKADWMDQSAPLDTIQLFKKSHPVGMAGAAKESLSRLVRRQRGD